MPVVRSSPSVRTLGASSMWGSGTARSDGSSTSRPRSVQLIPEGPVDLDELRDLRARIPKLVRFGTSSWNYTEGWRGLVYHRKYPKSVSVAKLLAEYVEFPLFDTVGIDAAFYRPLSAATYRNY